MAWPKKRNPAYDKPEWRRARKAQLERDGWRCQIRLPGCLGTAGEVDHVLGIEADPHHRVLRSACAPCHKQVTSAQSSRGHREPPANPNTVW
jgi:5-methylcytosine-specific restriction protein A